MINRRQLLRILPVGGLGAVGLSACSKSAGAAGGSTLTWYTDHDAQEVQGVISVFAQQSGIKINLFTSTSAGVVSKATAEVASNKQGADVITVAGPLSYEGLRKGKVPADLPTSVAQAVPKQSEAFTSTDGKWFSVYTTIVGVAYNTDKVDAAHAPKNFQSFTDPYWKGKFSIPISTNSTSVQSYYQMMQASWLGKSFLTTLGNNGPVSSQHSGQQVSDLITGNQVGAIVNDDAVWPQIIKGAPLKYVYPPKGMAAIHDYNLLVQGAANATAAEKFLQFLTTDDALTALAKGGSTIDIPGVTLAPPERPTVDKLTFFPAIDPEKLLAAQGEMAPYLTSVLHE